MAKFCGNCGTQLDDDSMFCPECGCKVDEYEPDSFDEEENSSNDAQKADITDEFFFDLPPVAVVEEKKEDTIKDIAEKKEKPVTEKKAERKESAPAVAADQSYYRSEIFVKVDDPEVVSGNKPEKGPEAVKKTNNKIVSEPAKKDVTKSNAKPVIIGFSAMAVVLLLLLVFALLNPFKKDKGTEIADSNASENNNAVVQTDGAETEANNDEEEELTEEAQTEAPFVADVNATGYASVSLEGRIFKTSNDVYRLVLAYPQNMIVTNNSNGQNYQQADVTEVYLNDLDGMIDPSFDGLDVFADGSICFDANANHFRLDLEELTDADGNPIKVSQIHNYKVIHKDCTWFEAYEDAMKYKPEKNSHLVTIDDEEELAYVKSLLDSDMAKHYFIGATRENDSKNYYFFDENGKFYGTPLNNPDSCVYDEWMDKEPSYKDKKIIENRVDFLYYQDKWMINDIPDDILSIYAGRVAYIIEYED